MPTYFVSWEIDIDADSPREAAMKALEIQRDSTSSAIQFYVQEFETDNRLSVDLYTNEISEA